jgi:uncharacterized Zn finger protein
MQGVGENPLANIDLRSAKNITCDKCSNATFEKVHIIKHISAVLSPSGREGIVPIPVYSCVACGWVNQGFLPPELREPEYDGVGVRKDTPNKSIIMEK